MKRVSILVPLVLVASATLADAQVVQRPPRSTGGLFGGLRSAAPDRTTQQLWFNVDLLGEYGGNTALEGQAPQPGALAPQQAALSGIVTTGLRYWRGRTSREFEASVRGHLTSFQHLDLDVRPLYGGNAILRGRIRVLGETNLTGSLESRYQPTLSLAGSNPSVDPGTAPDPLVGVAERRSLSHVGLASIDRAWSSRHQSTVTGTHTRQVYFGETMDTIGTTVSARHAWSLFRNASIDSTYQRTHVTVAELTGGRRPLESDSLSLGVTLRRQISPTRQLVVSGGPAAVRVRTVDTVDRTPIEYIAPSGFGSVRIDVARTWAVAADFRRDTTMLYGLTRQSFLTDSIGLSLGGLVGRRWTVAASGTFADGAPHQGETGAFSSTSGTAQVQYALGGCCQLLASYMYYGHRINDVASLPEGFPPRYDRNTVRFGFTWRLPLYGTFPPSGPRGN